MFYQSINLVVLLCSVTLAVPLNVDYQHTRFLSSGSSEYADCCVLICEENSHGRRLGSKHIHDGDGCAQDCSGCDDSCCTCETSGKGKGGKGGKGKSGSDLVCECEKGCEGTDAPETLLPGTDEPTTEVPETKPPKTYPPETKTPETEPPATESPETKPPKTNPPETEVPETEPPATELPETKPPKTYPPETEAPETEHPATEKPETKAPETEPPATKEPETETPATEYPTYPPHDGKGKGGMMSGKGKGGKGNGGMMSGKGYSDDEPPVQVTDDTSDACCKYAEVCEYVGDDDSGKGKGGMMMGGMMMSGMMMGGYGDEGVYEECNSVCVEYCPGDVDVVDTINHTYNPGDGELCFPTRSYVNEESCTCDCGCCLDGYTEIPTDDDYGSGKGKGGMMSSKGKGMGGMMGGKGKGYGYGDDSYGGKGKGKRDRELMMGKGGMMSGKGKGYGYGVEKVPNFSCDCNCTCVIVVEVDDTVVVDDVPPAEDDTPPAEDDMPPAVDDSPVKCCEYSKHCPGDESYGKGGKGMGGMMGGKGKGERQLKTGGDDCEYVCIDHCEDK
jgi:hypothetical protein